MAMLNLGLITLQICSQCILLVQPTGLVKYYMSFLNHTPWVECDTKIIFKQSNASLISEMFLICGQTKAKEISLPYYLPKSVLIHFPKVLVYWETQSASFRI